MAVAIKCNYELPKKLNGGERHKNKDTAMPCPYDITDVLE